MTNLIIPSLQRLLDRRHRQEELEFIRRQRNKPQMLVKCFCVVVFGVHEQTKTARHAEDLKELLHRRDQQDVSEAAPIVVFGDRQTPQANPCYAARQFSRLNRRKCIRLDPAEV